MANKKEIVKMKTARNREETRKAEKELYKYGRKKFVDQEQVIVSHVFSVSVRF
jgi:hypothetical protein